MTSIAFEHFDPEMELFNLDENGRPLRPRKKPGRKPNPPSPAQRKAQNRAAQRAFRERKRREMREVETTVRQSQREIQKLRKQMDMLRFENNYLKGALLTLKLACTANRVDVPKFFDTGVRDELGADRQTFSRTKGVPQSLEFFLDRHMHIIEASGNLDLARACAPSHSSILPHLTPAPLFSAPLMTTSPASSYSCSDNASPLFPHGLSDPHQFPIDLSTLDLSALDLSTIDLSTIDLSTILSIAPQLVNQLDPSMSQQLLMPSALSCPLLPSQSPPPSTITSPEVFEFPDEGTDHTTRPGALEAFIRGGLEAALARVTTDTSDKEQARVREQLAKSQLQPMSAMNAITYLYAIQQLDESHIPPLFTPTELQRAVPHDARIDLIPGETMRDHMIIFQDYYDANELFNFLIQTGHFLGGELGNPDCWYVPPSFLQKYWYLCPNHIPERIDNVVDVMVQLGKCTIEDMLERKKMYIQREQFAHCFPPPTVEREMDAPSSGSSDAASPDLVFDHLSQDSDQNTQPMPATATV